MVLMAESIVLPEWCGFVDEADVLLYCLQIYLGK